MKHQPPRRTVIVDGQTLAYTLAGQGTARIVLLNGAGGPLEGWFRLYPQLERLGVVLAYDRPGVGGSPRSPHPQTGEAAVCTLRGLLQAVRLEPPYLLVGHSFGGLHANLFARRHPDEVAGVVFLEASAPEDVVGMKAHQTLVQRALNAVLARRARPDPYGEIGQERMTVAQIAAAPPFPDVPVCVLSGGKAPPRWLMAPEALALRRSNQAQLARLSPRGWCTVAARSGHFPQLSEPQAVLDAIAQVQAAVAQTHGSPTPGMPPV
ncbi:alpha/beta hydrolase [Chitiniphilus purpureus]|uniref:Alpha/beta hydrolase n=1 Tax=Chitiniphilus purpureus TaxID=2981137 RepID=A0ABY6DRB4_9NEIS|nr:alpha/beta hydrolase [Chitiniphilus sp. CD1]UXY16914.1 alpha/beta hydrolase [Chitiniphilus sp. CD1]